MNGIDSKISLPAIVLLGAACFLSWVPAARSAETLNPGLEALLNVSNTGESWTDEWHVIDTAVDFPGSGRAGFYRRAGQNGDANPRTGRTGILYLYPEDRYRPARILAKDLTLPEDNPRLEIGVAANWNPRGEWGLTVKADGRQLFEEVVISGREGWQDLVFALAPLGGQRVDIVLEAGGASHSNSYVFIDYIQITSGSDASAQDPAASMEEQGFFDRAYLYFLELLNIREEKRSQRIQDQVYQDQQQVDQDRQQDRQVDRNDP